MIFLRDANRQATRLLFRHSAFLLLLAANFAGPITAEAKQDSQGIQWRTDIEKAKREAAESNKFVLLHFYGDFCGPCKKLDRFVFIDPKVQSTIHQHTIPVKINVEKQKAVATEYDLKSIPFDIAITPAGHVLTRRRSPQSSDGYLRMINGTAAAKSRIAESTFRAQQELQKREEYREALAGSQATATHRDATQSKLSQVPGRTGRFSMQPTSEVTPYVEIKTPDADAVAQKSNASSSFTVQPEFESNPGHGLSNASSSFLAPMQNGRNQTRNSFATNPHFNSKSPLVPKSDPNVATPSKPDPGPLTVVNTSFERTPPRGNTEPRGLDGNCPVTWATQQRFVKGDARWGCRHRGQLYLFASPQLRDQFELSPDVYSPVLAGFDPVIFESTGKLVPGKIENRLTIGDAALKTTILFATPENRDRFSQHSNQIMSAVRTAMQRVDANRTIR